MDNWITYLRTHQPPCMISGLHMATWYVLNWKCVYATVCTSLTYVPLKMSWASYTIKTFDVLVEIPFHVLFYARKIPIFFSELSRLTLASQYSRMHAAIINCDFNNDATTTHEYFTGRNTVQIQPSGTLPSLTISLWNSTLKLTISQTTITETMKQICVHLSQLMGNG